MKVFGIGCIYFGYKSLNGKIPERLRDQDAYLKTLRDRLESVENVSDVTFNNMSDGNYNSVSVIRHEGYEVLVPILHGGSHIEFDIYLPFRIQDGILARCDVEAIHIDIVYGYEMPIMVFSYDWPDEEGDAQPSGAVAVVRKFLEKKLSDSEFVCDCVGPSPFHANFALIESDLTETPSISDVSGNRLGYANLEITASRDSEIIKSILATGLDSVISTFYALSETRSQAISAQNLILESSRQLLDQKAPATIGERWRAFRHHPKSVDTLNSEVFQEMLLRLNMSQTLAESDRCEITGEGQVMNRFFAEYRAMACEEAWSKFSDVAKFFEERRQKMIGNAAAIAAGLIGGVIGSIIGSLATFLLTRTASLASPLPAPQSYPSPATALGSAWQTPPSPPAPAHPRQ